MDDIEKVFINTHSSSEYSSASTKEGKYILNQLLSQDRSDTVLSYLKQLDNDIIKDNEEWISSSFQAIGKSSQNLIMDDDGQEDQEKSRRLEFVIKLKNK